MRSAIAALGYTPPMIADTDIQRAAKELIERHGGSALTVARERIDALSAARDHAGMDIALRVLTALEFQLEVKPPKS